MKTFLTFTVFAVCCTLVLSQTKEEPIKVKRSVLTNNFYFSQNGKSLYRFEVQEILQSNQLAYDEFRISNRAKLLSNLSYISGCLIMLFGLAHEDINWGLEFVGVGIVICAVPLHFRYMKKTVSAINIYNEGLNTGSLMNKNLDLSFGFSRQGVGLRVNF